MMPSTSPVAVWCSSASRNSALRSLQFLEQPHVLDGDDGLVGEGLQQSDLFVRERSDFGAANYDRPDRNTFTQQRRRQAQSESRTCCSLLRVRETRFALGREDPGCGSICRSITARPVGVPRVQRSSISPTGHSRWPILRDPSEDYHRRHGR